MESRFQSSLEREVRFLHQQKGYGSSNRQPLSDGSAHQEESSICLGFPKDKDCLGQATHVGSCYRVTPEIHRCIFTFCDYTHESTLRQRLWCLASWLDNKVTKLLISSTCAIRAFTCRKAFNRLCNQMRSERTLVEFLSRLVKQSSW
jgi:hypothetical protein